MAITQTGEPTPQKPLRLWPGVVAAVLLLLVRVVVPVVAPNATFFGLPLALVGLLGGAFGGLAIVVWWLFFSRAPWSERLGAIILMIVALLATSRLAHESIAGAGMGMLLYILAVPVQGVALVVWAVASRRLSSGLRRASLVATILLACGVFTLLRTGGITGDADSDFHWRWTKTPEERLLAQAGNELLDSARGGPTAPEKPVAVSASDASVPPASAPAVEPLEKPLVAAAGDQPASLPVPPAATKTAADWPGFRGPDRDDVIHGVRIETDWSKSPPVALWRRPIGPGWSSIAVRGNLIYTQEQRGDDEIVASYNLTTGKPVWMHRDATRFWESNAGAGPRATPTLSNGRVYTFGATGIVNTLDARDGSVVWSRNAASDTGATLPGWGFAGSPLVVNDVVIVAASGRLVAYDVATGNPRWFRQTGGGSYSSPHRVTIHGVEQVLLLNGGGATSVAPADGTVLWDHRWPESSGSIVQPALTTDGDVLIGAIDSSAGGFGTRRIALAHGPGGWTVEERWTSTGLKPGFNDYVVHKGHAFGFDGSILASIDLENGKRDWKGGRYGNGQLVLLPDQDLLLVLSEEGELALVKATPDHFTELARFPALEGKTWNHPVLVGDVLLVRNGEEMAAFRLSLPGR
jgi:outer membrane protein assembly factor BamB